MIKGDQISTNDSEKKPLIKAKNNYVFVSPKDSRTEDEKIFDNDRFEYQGARVGTVVAVGPDVDGLAIGDQIVYDSAGSIKYGEYEVIPYTRIFAKEEQ